MRKNILTICFLVISSSIDAQQSDMKIGIGADLGIPYRGFMIHDSKTGFGGYIKGLKGIGKASQITVTTGYSIFPAKESGGPDKATHSIFSILPGYRYTFRGLYIEPQAGYCSMHSKFEPANGFVSPTTRFRISDT
jgi:hypothetical protein